MPRPTTRLDAIAATLLFVALAAPARAQPPGPREAGKPPENGRQWALLIGVEKYQKELPLAFTVNDVTILAKTLRERNGFGADEVLTMTDDAEPANLRPTAGQPHRGDPAPAAQIGRGTGCSSTSAATASATRPTSSTSPRSTSTGPTRPRPACRSSGSASRSPTARPTSSSWCSTPATPAPRRAGTDPGTSLPRTSAKSSAGSNGWSPWPARPARRPARSGTTSSSRSTATGSTRG